MFVMEKLDIKTREYEFIILEEPSKDNDYTCTCAGSLFSNKTDMELSIITMTPDDLPDSVEEIMIYVTKQKCKIDLLRQALEWMHMTKPPE